MRRILIILLILSVTMLILWVFAGRQISLIAEKFGTLEITSEPVKSLVFESGGVSGSLIVNGLHLSLDRADLNARAPNVGTTKDNQVALSFAGKVFAFGPSKPTSDDSAQLTTSPDARDVAIIERRRGILSWIVEPHFQDIGHQSWERHTYYQLFWRKPNGDQLRLLWRYEQVILPNEKRWPLDETLSPPIHPTGLIQIDISTATR